MTSNEHVLVCISSASSNIKIIKAGYEMARAFNGSFTALLVKDKYYDQMREKDKKQLEKNLAYAGKCDAKVVSVYGNDIAYQIAQYARLSNVTKIFIGQNTKWLNRESIADKIIDLVDCDVYIVANKHTNGVYWHKVFSNNYASLGLDLLITILITIIATLIGLLFLNLGFTEANIITIYILSVLLNSLITRNYVTNVFSCLISVMVFNFFFTIPRLTFHAYDPGYQATFAIMLISSLITATLASKLKEHAKQSANAAFRTRVLFDTNQLLQKAKDEKQIINVIASQLLKMLNRDIIVYLKNNDNTNLSYLFTKENSKINRTFFDEDNIVEYVFSNGKMAGATTDIYNDAKCLYLAIKSNDKVYGVVGIHIEKNHLDAFENSVVMSILGECALAIENIRNAKAKEEAAIIAENEKLRANLLRAISHDLRTPLTSISGNASNLVNNSDYLDNDTLKQMYKDIYDDSLWLINIIENLLSITKIDQGKMNINMSAQLLEDVINEAMMHIDHNSINHHITTSIADEIMIIDMDAKLIMQLIINIVDNAIKYTHKGSNIAVEAYKKDNNAIIKISDDGDGIKDKEKVFEMFYTGNNATYDGRRSLGLGLALCKSIVKLHHGTLSLIDNEPHGTIFIITLPLKEVILHG